MEGNGIKSISKSVCNRNQSQKALQRRHICLTDSDNDCIIGGIKRRNDIKYERDISVDNNEE